MINMAIVIIILVGNEFAFRTFRQNVIDGLNRNDLILGKLILIFTIAIYTFLMVLLAIIIFGSIYTKDFSLSIIFENSHLILIYFLQAINYFSREILPSDIVSIPLIHLSVPTIFRLINIHTIKMGSYDGNSGIGRPGKKIIRNRVVTATEYLNIG